MLQTEEKIIEHCQQGDIEEFGKLYDAYINKIFRFVYYKTYHKETAEDITSLVFIKALKSINQFQKNKGAFQSWLFRIARNTVVDYYRAKKKMINIEDVWDLSGSEDVPADLDKKESLEKIKKHLSKLESLQREIIILRVWEEMPYKQIAKIVDLSEANCRVIFLRALKKLKGEMPLMLILLLLIKL